MSAITVDTHIIAITKKHGVAFSRISCKKVAMFAYRICISGAYDFINLINVALNYL